MNSIIYLLQTSVHTFLFSEKVVTVYIVNKE